MAEEEKSRLEEQRTQLGENGLAEKAKQLQEAMDFNEVIIQYIRLNWSKESFTWIIIYEVVIYNYITVHN